jgi:hypothetical protein
MGELGDNSAGSCPPRDDARRPIDEPPPWTLQLTQWFILTMELASPVLLFLRPRWQYLVVVFLLLFHLATFSMITIIFLPHVLCLASFLPLERLVTGRSQIESPTCRTPSSP